MGFVSRGVQESRRLDLTRHLDELEPETPTGVTPLLLVVGFALAIRLYLSLTNYCISGDGVAYLAMARHFADGKWRAALGAVYSPLYPALISLMHWWFTDWEMAGILVSAILGTAAVVTIYLMTCEAFGRRDLGFGAAVLMAVHPQTAAYSASVRTEAGYIFLVTGATWLLLRAVKEQRAVLAAAGGVAAGLGYLYRTEAIGFLPLGILLFLVAGWLWKQASHRWLFAGACVFALAFALIAAPYIAYLRIATGHWSIGREFTAAMMYGMGDVARNGGEWRRLGWSATASPLMAIFGYPRLYAEKVGHYLVVSTYNFAQALEPLLVVMLGIGIWARSRVLFATPPRLLKESPPPAPPSVVSPTSGRELNDGSRLSETFLAAIVLFYFCGFTLSYTGTRFMVHLIPFTFGWVAAGIIVMSEQAARWCGPSRRMIAHAMVPAAIAITLLPRTLWPLGYDMRGVRYAGEDIGRMTKGSAAVAARDGRVAYYAGARLIELPRLPPEDLCGWLRSNRGDFLMIGNHDETLFNVARGLRCLKLVKRYPRYGSGYYDLYGVRSFEQVPHSRTSDTEIGTKR